MNEEMNKKPKELSDEEMGNVAGGNSFIVDPHKDYTNLYICNGGVTARQFVDNYVGLKNVCGVTCARCPNCITHRNLDQGTVNAIVAGLPGYERYDFRNAEV